jgi:hypothetical protein
MFWTTFNLHVRSFFKNSASIWYNNTAVTKTWLSLSWSNISAICTEERNITVQFHLIPQFCTITKPRDIKCESKYGLSKAQKMWLYIYIYITGWCCFSALTCNEVSLILPRSLLEPSCPSSYAINTNGMCSAEAGEIFLYSCIFILMCYHLL